MAAFQVLVPDTQIRDQTSQAEQIRAEQAASDRAAQAQRAGEPMQVIPLEDDTDADVPDGEEPASVCESMQGSRVVRACPP